MMLGVRRTKRHGCSGQTKEMPITSTKAIRLAPTRASAKENSAKTEAPLFIF